MTIRLVSDTRTLVISETRHIRLEYTDPDSATAALGHGSKAHIRGEAIHTWLPDGRVFIALLQGVSRKGDEGYNALFVSGAKVKGAAYDKRVDHWRKVPVGSRFDLPVRNWPFMITARISKGRTLTDVVQIDPNDPKLPGTDLRVGDVVLEKTKGPVSEFTLPAQLSCLRTGQACSDFRMGPDLTDPSIFNPFIAKGF
ncbi:hypothetical protein [Sulfitobacter aestuariivivens]|uniref:Uncharacterized protein n=1 Tax=Sulfitobacter aestuariivivens TaxID=2766981 RepID=A0A927D9B0_9RHOB|nr:hypothetical protein [Sulfitobacter aestuariivivens]MBD3665562.1 hypothetical protein [Sulfitobacter aestuariivivens]